MVVKMKRVVLKRSPTSRKCGIIHEKYEKRGLPQTRDAAEVQNEAAGVSDLSDLSDLSDSGADVQNKRGRGPE